MKAPQPGKRPLIVRIASRFGKLMGRSSNQPTRSNEEPKKQDTHPAQPPSGKPSFPKTDQEAHERLHAVLAQRAQLQELSHEEFILGWASMAYIAPGLNPDEASTEDGGWPLGWELVAAEAFRRFAAKELTKEELYPRSS